MSKKAHTPGPWRIERGKKYGDFLIWSARGETEVSSHWIATLKCESCPAQEEANARLMAAAPDMLEALEPFVEVYEHFIGDDADEDQNRTISIPVKAFRRASAALSKATGGE